VNLFIAESLCSGKGFDESFSVIVDVVQQQKFVKVCVAQVARYAGIHSVGQAWAELLHDCKLSYNATLF
jgi:hypothetical protein